ncbi:MAG: GtrA family protein [Candidatus Methanoplasma sp.]|jgi:putative flippase GtrA|nr:GtrA family protein [Candidatus Methanoplasma sp.]
MEEFTKKHRESVLYVGCGAGTVAVSWVAYAVFVWAGIDLNVSNALSWICAVSFAFVVNKWVVFRSQSVQKNVLAAEMSLFFLLRILTGAVAIAVFPLLYMVGLDQSFMGVEGFIARVAVSLVEIVLNYLASKFLVFRSA